MEPGGSASPGGADPEEAARQICLRLLATAPRTRAQLATALRRRRVPEEIAEAVLGRFAEVRLIDDAAFAQAWVESRHHGRGLARRALSAELRQRGVAAEEVRAAVGSLGDAGRARHGAAAGGEAGRGDARPPTAGQGAPPRRHAGPQGVPGRVGLPGGARGARAEGQRDPDAGFGQDALADLDNVFGADIAADAAAGDE